MGGRGGSGMGSAHGGAGFKIPTLTGSEKQVSWATDILKNPYDTMVANAKMLEKQAIDLEKTKKGYGDEFREQASAFKAAQQRYTAEIANLVKMFPNGMKASEIIDKKSGIKAIANTILAAEYKKRPRLKSFIPLKF